MKRREFLQLSGLAALAASVPFIQVPDKEYEIASNEAFEMYNIWPGVSKRLDVKTLEAVQLSKTDTLIQPIKSDGDNYIKNTNRVYGIGVHADTLEDGIVKMSNILKDVSNKFLIKGHLLETKSMALKTIYGTYICFSYLIFDHTNSEKEINEYKYNFIEGSMPIYEGKKDIVKLEKEYNEKIHSDLKNALIEGKLHKA